MRYGLNSLLILVCVVSALFGVLAQGSFVAFVIGLGEKRGHSTLMAPVVGSGSLTSTSRVTAGDVHREDVAY